MSTADFQAVVSALEAGGSPLPPEAPTVQTVAVLGANAMGQALAAASLAGGKTTRLWASSGASLNRLSSTGSITVRGDDLVGSYSVDPDAAVHIDLCASVDQALAGADLVFVTGTVAEQRSAAMLAAESAAEGQILVVVPGLTFGALELHWWLRSRGRAGCLVAELNPAPWTVSAGPDGVEISTPASTRVATMPAGAGMGLATALAEFLPPAEVHPTVVHTSLMDPSGAIEVPALVLGGPGLAPDPEHLLPGAVPRHDSLAVPAPTPQLASVIGALAGERRQVAAKWGVRDIPDDSTWLGTGEGDVPAIPSLAASAARDRVLDVTAGSLVPLASAAAAVGVGVPTTGAIIEIVTAMFGFDVRAAGRRLEAIGLAGADLDRIRRATTSVGAG